MTTYHPRLTEAHSRVELKRPSTPTHIASWHDSSELAIVIPEGNMPGRLNGIDIRPWSADPGEWAALAGSLDLGEPQFEPPAGVAAAAGVVIVEDDGRVWLVAPSNQFGGYAATFPKGRVDHGGDLRTTAVREAFEESGLIVRIEAFLIDVQRGQTYARYYMARRIGGTPSGMGWESQAVLLVPLARLSQLAVNQHDAPIIAALDTWHVGQSSAPISLAEDTTPEPVSVPFFSVRTLAEDYTLVAELRNDVAIYKHKSGKFATIGTRGHRPSDGSSGLIVHDTVSGKSPGQTERHRVSGLGPTNLSHWRDAKSPVATLLNVLDKNGVVLLA